MLKRIVLGIFTLGTALLSGIGFVAWTALSQDARPAAANNAISIPACAFQERANDYDFDRWEELSSDTGDEYYAPVVLPHGGTIRKIVLVSQEFLSLSNMDLFLYRQNLASQSFQIAKITTGGAVWGFRTFKTSVISPRLVNNFKNSYYLKVTLPANYPHFLLSQVKIHFDSP